MKASESINNYNAKLREYANYAARQVKDVCKTIGPRPSGEENEKKAQERFAEELKKYSDTVSIEPFDLHPKAFLGWVPLCAVLMILANLLFFIFGFSVVSLAVSALCLFFIVTEFLFYGETLDPFFPKRTSHNVVAVRKPKGEIKKRIIVSGHVDSSYEWRFTFLGGPKLITLVIGGAVVGIVIALVAEIYCVATGNLMTTPDNLFVTVLKWVMLAWCILFFAAIFFGYAVGVTPLVGYHYGAKNRRELRNLLKKSTLLMLLTGVVMFALGESLAGVVAKIYVGYDETLAQMTIHGMRLYAFMLIIMGLNVFASSFFTGLNNGLISAAISFLRSLVFEVIAILLLPRFWGINGVWCAPLFAEGLTLLVSFTLLWWNRKRYGYWG